MRYHRTLKREKVGRSAQNVESGGGAGVRSPWTDGREPFQLSTYLADLLGEDQRVSAETSHPSKICGNLDTYGTRLTRSMGCAQDGDVPRPTACLLRD